MSTFNDNRHDEVCDELEALEAKYVAAIYALHECVAWFEDNGVDCVALDEAREALKKAEGEK